MQISSMFLNLNYSIYFLAVKENSQNTMLYFVNPGYSDSFMHIMRRVWRKWNSHANYYNFGK
jgi:hypothetical protein